MNAMIRWGKFIGGRKLISPPIEVKKLFKSPFLAERVIIPNLGYERQAESAGWAVTPEMNVYSKKERSSKIQVVKLGLKCKNVWLSLEV